MKRFRVTLDEKFDSALLKRVENVFHGENLLQMILHAHLLLERGLNLLISQQLKRPDIVEDNVFGRWSFHQKIGMYVALYDPPEERKNMLVGFNQLRNALAHKFEDEESCVARYLPWDGESPPQSAYEHVRVVIMILFFELEIIKAIERRETLQIK